MRTIKTLFKWLGLALLMVIVGGFLPSLLGAYGLYWKRYANAFLTNPLRPGL